MDFFLHLLKPNICNESYEINKICKKISYSDRLKIDQIWTLFSKLKWLELA